MRVRVVGVRTVAEIPPAAALDPRANRGLMLDDILGRTEFYRRHLPTDDPAVEPGLVGAPITVIVVRNIAGHTTGCSLGMSADWVIAQAALFDPQNEHTYDETVLAHELGHALNLPHHRGPRQPDVPRILAARERCAAPVSTAWQRGADPGATGT